MLRVQRGRTLDPRRLELSPLDTSINSRFLGFMAPTEPVLTRLSRSASSRWLSVCCVLVLLFVGVAHNLSPDHYASLAGPTVSVLTSPSIDDAGTKSKGSLIGEVCPGCMTVTLPLPAIITALAPLADKVPSAPSRSVCEKAPAPDTPPPKHLT